MSHLQCTSSSNMQAFRCNSSKIMAVWQCLSRFKAA
jgi:hypothetical protein